MNKPVRSPPIPAALSPDLLEKWMRIGAPRITSPSGRFFYRTMMRFAPLYFDSVSPVIPRNWARGRVALLGDASSHRLCCGRGFKTEARYHRSPRPDWPLFTLQLEAAA
jgi:hypothetical protein